MFEFWLASAILFILAILFVIIPCIRFVYKENEANEIPVKNTAPHDERTQQNVLIYKERLAELEKDIANSRISTEEYQQLKDELDRALIEDADGEDISQANHSAEKAHSKAILPVILFSLFTIILISSAFYYKYGAYGDVAAYLDLKEHNLQLAKATDQAKNGDMSELLEQLHDKLKENPDNINGWSLLARTAMNTERYSLAIKGFKETIRIIKARPEVDVEDLAATYGILAQAQYYAYKGIFNSQVQASIDAALKINPSEPNTLSLIAIDAFTSGKYEQAISNWTKVIEAYPNHPAVNSIKQGIKEAQVRAGVAPAEETTINSPSINISVSIDKSLSGSTTPNDTVFIFVKDASYGDAPSPPLAASRHSVSELPLTITLSDVNAMSPMAKLSDAKLVNVIARISKSGDVKAASGDLEGKVQSVKAEGEQGVNIVINELID